MSETAELFDSEAGFRAAIDLTLAAARREVRIFDQDLVRLGIDDAAHVALLGRFLAAGSHRRLRIVLHDMAPLEKRSPRLLALIRQHHHAIEIRTTPDHLRQLTDCWVLADQDHGAIRFHADHPRGKRITAWPAEIGPWWQRFDELWEASEPCSPGAVTGL
jgi:hypothetical protein